MTRVNVVNVEELYDQHLVAEYREIMRLPNYLINSLQIGFNLNNIPPNYCLGTGHVKFFYDKGKWLEERFISLQLEMIKRGMNPNTEFTFNITPFIENNLYLNYIPTYDDIVLSRSRINERVREKPDYYTKTPHQEWVVKYRDTW